jgi:hypothetical protein
MITIFDDPLENIIAHSSEKRVYLGSPSLAILPNGLLIASHDFFGPKSPKNKFDESNLTHIYHSEDKGLTWKKISEIKGAFWSSLFTINNSLFLIGCSSEYGDIVIRRSDEFGKFWTSPNSDKNGLLFRSGIKQRAPNYHCAPVPVLIHDGFVYRAFEDNITRKWPQGFHAFVISAKLDSDLLKSSSWTITNKLAYELPSGIYQFNKKNAGWLEGNVVNAPNGEIWNILRINSPPLPNKAAIVKLSPDRKNLLFDSTSGYIDFPGGMSKFTIRYDPISKKYLTMANEVIDKDNPFQRNHLILASSKNLLDWESEVLLLYKSEKKSLTSRIIKFLLPSTVASFLISKIGFQYVDWMIDDEDLLFIVRTAYNGARNFHDSNYIPFHRLQKFRRFI